MNKNRCRFSMFDMLISLLWLSVFLGLNLSAEVEKTWSGKVATFLDGYHEFLADQLRIRRGWPLHFLDHTQFVTYGGGDAMIAAGWPRSDAGVPSVSHPSRLAIDVAVGLLLTLVLTYSSQLLVRLVSRWTKARRSKYSKQTVGHA